MTSPNLPMNEDDLVNVRAETSENFVTITLLKQYTYCPRVVYYETCTPGVRPVTYKMQVGTDAHDYERKRAARRSLAAYQLPGGKRHFDVRLVSRSLYLSALIDEVIVTDDEAFVVDYKLADWAGDNHLMQLAAYSLLLEEAFNLPVHRGFIYLMKSRHFESVPIDTTLRNSVLETLKSIERIRLYEYMPPPVEQKNKCESCEFRRFCSDI
jgi:CRISPR-associated exonuclease Cas4